MNLTFNWKLQKLEYTHYENKKKSISSISSYDCKKYGFAFRKFHIRPESVIGGRVLIYSLIMQWISRAGRISLNRTSKWQAPLARISESIVLDVNPLSSANPHLPSSYQRSSIQEIDALLRALIDSGSCRFRGPRDSVVNQLLRTFAYGYTFQGLTIARRNRRQAMLLLRRRGILFLFHFSFFIFFLFFAR